MRRRCGPALVFALALGGAALVALSCASSATKGDWKSQKAYGAEMARKGFWREALFRFEKAAAEHPDDGEIQNDLAVGYESIGETARALSAYKRALELAPENQKIKRNYARFAEYYTSVQRAPSTTLTAPAATASPAPASPAPATTPAPTSVPPEPAAPAPPVPVVTPAIPAATPPATPAVPMPPAPPR